MKQIYSRNSPDKKIIFIILLGLIVRIIYVFFFSKFHAFSYYGIASIFAKGPDINMWLECLDNLIQHGSFTSNINDPDGYFARMPGYAFFISLFYFLPGENSYLYCLCFFQVLCDALNIYFIYRISESIFDKKSISYVAAAIYAIHPINLIWAPFLSADSPAIFLMLWSLFIYTNSKSKYSFFFFGLVAGFNILVRPQMALFVLAYFFYFIFLIIKNKNSIELKNFITFCLAIGLSYGSWPARNFLFHHELVLTHKISAIPCWRKDVEAYVAYNYSVQSNWQPQFDQILQNKPVYIDKGNAYKYPPDSALLRETIYLCKNYGSGFSEWPSFWKGRIAPNKYDTIIVNNFELLRQHQIQYNSFHYWFVLPLENLKKCFFKLDLLSSKNQLIIMAVALIFSFRTLIIFLGIAGSVYFFRQRKLSVIAPNLLFFSLWYLSISAGDPHLLRNVEMRYLIQCDTLLIIPAAYLLHSCYEAFIGSGLTTLLRIKR